MTDRRSHWDIDLVEGVGRRLIPRYRSIGYCTDAERDRIYTLIEFVEDWVIDNFQGGEYDNPVEFTPEELAITRVQEVCDQADEDGTALVWLADVRRALEGDSDE